MNFHEVQPTPPARLREYLTELHAIADEFQMEPILFRALAPSMLAVLAERQFFPADVNVPSLVLDGLRTPGH